MKVVDRESDVASVKVDEGLRLVADLLVDLAQWTAGDETFGGGDVNSVAVELQVCDVDEVAYLRRELEEFWSGHGAMLLAAVSGVNNGDCWSSMEVLPKSIDDGGESVSDGALCTAARAVKVAKCTF